MSLGGVIVQQDGKPGGGGPLHEGGHLARVQGRNPGIETEKRCTPAQLALAWVIAQGDFIFAIPGTRRSDHLEENWRAQQVRLTPADLAQIREDLPESAIAGERYTPEVMVRVDRS